MYIWILLATIMVALSFFNLSPRPDKDYSINELKAATVVNRFKAEHVAMSKYMECEIVKQTNNSNWDGIGGARNSADPTKCPIQVSYDGTQAVPNLAYTKVECYLPIGYERTSALEVKHFIYCIDDKAEAIGERSFVACDKTRNRYLVSYAKIPDPWLSKENVEDGKYRTPVPMFMTFLSKATSAGSTYGWTDCVDNSCILRGYSSRAGRHNRDENNVQIYEYTLLSGDSILWSEAKKSSAEGGCRGRPCLFAYTHMPVSDVANHCYRLMRKDNNQCGEGSAEAGTGGEGGENETEPETPSGAGDEENSGD